MVLSIKDIPMEIGIDDIIGRISMAAITVVKAGISSHTKYVISEMNLPSATSKKNYGKRFYSQC